MIRNDGESAEASLDFRDRVCVRGSGERVTDLRATMEWYRTQVEAATR
jgi:hypothetical protein